MNRHKIARHAPLLALVLTGAATMAWVPPGWASPGPGDTVSPGTQSAPPGPGTPTPPELVTDPDQRRAIRGCPVDKDCNGDALEGLRQFEIEAFGAPGKGNQGSPWLDDPVLEDDPDGRQAVKRPRGLVPGSAVRGSELRPDLPWLDDLAMPDIPVRWNDRLIEYLVFYKDDPRGRNIMRGWLRAQGKYRDLLVSHLRKARLPEDLLYVAMIESSYNPAERSRVGAAGLWQFMPAGGRIYGLLIDRWIDERNDPVRSTEAAMMYWADLYQRFGDWHLAMAAYNGGYGAVLKGVATFNSNDFWELSAHENALPWGTSLYVPKALATAIVGRNRAFFGFDDLEPAPAVTWDNVSVPKSTSLGAIARAAGTDVDTIQMLNPQLRRNRTPPSLKDYVLRIPGGKRALFAERFPQLRGDWDQYDAYVVAHGQRFEDIATMYGINRYRLAKLNGLSHESEVRGGVVLVVPRITEAEKQANLEKARDDLYASGSPRGKEGDNLVVAVPDRDFQVEGKKRVFYRVVTGDTQYVIAKSFEVSRTELAAWNGLRRDAHLHPRMVLQVFVDKGFKAGKRGIELLDARRLTIVTRGSDEHLDSVEDRRGRERVVYKAKKRGESFESIGKKYGLTARDLARINNRPHSTELEEGEEIIVYQVVDRSRSDRAKAQARSQRRSNRRSKSAAKPAEKSAEKPDDKASDEPAKEDTSADDEAEPADDEAEPADEKPEPERELKKDRPKAEATPGGSDQGKDKKAEGDSGETGPAAG